MRSAGAYDAARALADGRVGASVLLGDVAQGAGAKAVRPANDRAIFVLSPSWSASHGGRKHSHPRSPGRWAAQEGRDLADLPLAAISRPWQRDEQHHGQIDRQLDERVAEARVVHRVERLEPDRFRGRLDRFVVEGLAPPVPPSADAALDVLGERRGLGGDLSLDAGLGHPRVDRHLLVQSTLTPSPSIALRKPDSTAGSRVGAAHQVASVVRPPPAT